MYAFEQRTLDYRTFPGLFATEIQPDPRHRLMYAHLSTDPDTLLEQAILYTYDRTATPTEPVPPLRRASDSRFARFVFNLARTGSLGQSLSGRRSATCCRTCARAGGRATRHGACSPHTTPS